MTNREYNKKLTDYPTALTVAEIAQILRVSTKTVYKIINRKELPAMKIGREKRISKADLIKYLRRRDTGSTNPECVLSDNSAHKVWTSGGFCGIVRVGENRYARAIIMKGADKNGRGKHKNG